jgi:hypothetical protein
VRNSIFLHGSAALLMALSLAQAGASPATAPADSADSTVAPLPADASVDTVLDALDARGKNLTDLTVDVKKSDIDPTFGTAKTYVGHLWLQRRSADDATVHVMFDKVIDGRFSRAEKHEYQLAGIWLIDRDYHAKLENKYQIAQQGQKTDFFKLGEGSFPLPIGQDKADVHRDFDATLAKPAATDPAGTIHIVLATKPGTSLARRFSQIDVWIDRATDMPVRIDTLDNQQAVESIVMENVKINTPGGLKPADLLLEPVDQKDWTISPAHAYQG